MGFNSTFKGFKEKEIHASAGFEPAMSASEGPQTNALDGAATVIGVIKLQFRVFSMQIK
jgi:hypothetical protein